MLIIMTPQYYIQVHDRTFKCNIRAWLDRRKHLPRKWFTRAALLGMCSAITLLCGCVRDPQESPQDLREELEAARAQIAAQEARILELESELRKAAGAGPQVELRKVKLERYRIEEELRKELAARDVEIDELESKLESAQDYIRRLRQYIAAQQRKQRQAARRR